MILFALYSPLFTACTESKPIPDAEIPTIKEIYISPEDGAKTNENLVCVVTSEGTPYYPTTLNIEWKNETSGEMIGTESQIQLDRTIVAPEDVVSCTATVSNESGSVTESVEIEVLNTAPVITDLDIGPEGNRYTTSLLSCTAFATDEDGDLPTLSYSWTKQNTSSPDSEETLSETSSTLQLNPTDFQVGDIITCHVVAEDASGEQVEDNTSIQISNFR